MKKILKYKNGIIVGFSIVLLIIFSVFIFNKFYSQNSFKTKIDYSGNIGNYAVIKNELYILNSKNLSKYGKNGKLKLTKEFPNSGNIKVSNDVLYLLEGSDLIVLNTSFEEVKREKLEGKNLDFFVEKDKIVVVGDDVFYIFDATLNKLYSKKIEDNIIYAKFSKESNKFLYIDYLENNDGFKSRFSVEDYAEDKILNGFTFFNELIIDAGFLSSNSEDYFVLTNDKFYIFNGSTIKDSIFISNLKDFKFENEKLYILSDKLEVFDIKTLKSEKTIPLKEAYENVNILNSKIVLSNKEGYIEINNKDEIKTFKETILETVQNKDGLFFILQDGYIKVK